MARRVGTAVLIAAAMVGVLFLIYASPLALGWLSGDRGYDWTELSNIGQSYGATSALLSGIALLAVAFTTYSQVRESRMARREANRMMHLEIVKIGLDNPTYLRLWGGLRESTEQIRETAYTNLIVNYWYHQVLAGVLSNAELDAYLRTLFQEESGRRYWLQARDAWLSQGFTSTRAGKRFVQTAVAAFEMTTVAPTSTPALVPLTQAAPRPSDAGRSAVASLAGLAIVVAVCGIARRRTRPDAVHHR